MLVPKPLAALVLFAATLAPCYAATTQSTVWCSSALDTDDEQNAIGPIVVYQHARRKLCAGDAAGARAGFATILPTMSAGYRTDGTHWIDYERSYFYALLASGKAAEARRFLTQEVDNKLWKPTSAERLFWNDDYAGSFAAYVADDGRVVRTPDQQAEHKLDPHLPAALQAVRTGRLDDALADMKAVADDGSLYRLMRGNLYAQQRRWPEAFAAWVAAAAAGPGFAQPGWYSLDEWNISALEMIYYYRAHAPTYKP